MEFRNFNWWTQLNFWTHWERRQIISCIMDLLPQSQWKTTVSWYHSASLKKRLRQNLSTKTILPNVFWDHKGIIFIDLMEPETTITMKVFYEMLSKLIHVIQDWWCELLVSELFSFTVHIHTSQHVSFWWELFDHSRYSPTLVTSDFYGIRNSMDLSWR